MGKPMTATELRKDIYRVLDEVVETGVPQEILRGKHRLLIVTAAAPQSARLRLAELPRRQALACTPEELVDTSWDGEWEGRL